MCMGAAIQARIGRLVYGCADPKAGAAGSIYDLAGDRRLNHTIRVTPGVAEDESRELLRSLLPSPSRPVTSTRESRIARLVESLPGGGPVVWSPAPGRVNVIGDHTDYNGLPVLPFAIGATCSSLRVHGATGGSRSRTATPRHGPREFELGGPVAPFEAGDWGNYVKAAVGALAAGRIPIPQVGRRWRSMVAFRSPPGCPRRRRWSSPVRWRYAALGGQPVDPLGLAELLARGEQDVGTLSGGMDQAAILLRPRRHALRIDFLRLRVRQVRMPDDVALHRRPHHRGSGEIRPGARAVQPTGASNVGWRVRSSATARIRGPDVWVASGRPGRRSGRPERVSCPVAPCHVTDLTRRFGLRPGADRRLVPGSVSPLPTPTDSCCVLGYATSCRSASRGAGRGSARAGRSR